MFQTTCPYCGVGCGVIVEKNNLNELKVSGDESYPSNKGALCSKGLNLHYVASDYSDRILYPMQRKNRNDGLTRVSWNSALDQIANKFKESIKNFGPDSVGFYVSGQLLTEEYYIINKLLKGFLKTNNIDTNSRLCMSSAVVGYKMALGEDSVPINYEDLDIADCFLIAGANPAYCHPVIFRRIEKRKLENPDFVKMIVIDPRRTDSCELADVHLQLIPGTDIYIFHAIARILIEEGKIDSEFVKNHTEGFEELKTKVFELSLDEVAEISGVEKKLIIEAAKIIGDSKSFLTLWAMGLNQSVIGVNKNLALLNLSLITGQIGKPGSGPFSLTGQPNAMGGREVGGLSNLLPAHRNLADPKHRDEVAKFWNVSSLNEKPGYTAVEMFENLDSGKMKVIWIACTNPTVSMPDVRMVEAALKKAELVIVQDISMNSSVIPFADFVLPAAGWIEKQGTMTNSERRISYLPKIIDPPEEAKADTWIIREFAKKMGFENSFNYKDEEEVFLEHARLTKNTNIDISALNYNILKSERSIQWPFPEKNHQGTKRLFTDGKFYRPNGLAKIHAVDAKDPSEIATEKLPFILTTGRIRDQWHTMTKTAKVQKLMEHRPEPFVEIHPEDAENLKINESDIVELKNERGNVKVRAKISSEIRKKTLFMPMHWGKKLDRDDGRVNNLTSSNFDPMSKQPGFKISAVSLELYKKKKEKILIIGGGNGTLAFVKKYRKLNKEDDIQIICKEPFAFYNRVLLPEYIGGEKKLDELFQTQKDEIDSWNLKIESDTLVEKIFAKEKKVLTNKEKFFDYDKLIIATGSSPSIPKNFSKDMYGVFSLRSEADAKKIKGFFVPNSNAIIVGGGLVGLELAGALKSQKVDVTLLVRGNKLMAKQLDDIAAEILKQEILERGIEIKFGVEIKSFKGNDRISTLKLSDGTELSPDGIIFATGTTPNIHLGFDAGLKCNEGILVNSWMQTSDPNIYSIGEAAEHHTGLYGTTAATEEQATVATEHVFGFANNEYKGSVHTNILKVPELNLISIRKSFVDMDAKVLKDGYDEVVFLDRKKKKYKKCILKDNHLVGAILIGDKSDFLEFNKLISTGMELGEIRDTLLSGNLKPSKPVIGKLVCSCNSVGEGNIKACINNGADTLEKIISDTGAGSGCGSCRPEVGKILKSSLGLKLSNV